MYRCFIYFLGSVLSVVVLDDAVKKISQDLKMIDQETAIDDLSYPKKL